MQELQELVIKWNNMFSADDFIVNLMTGIIVTITILSMMRFKFTPSSKFKWSRVLYFNGCIAMLGAIGINRFVGYPPSYPASSGIYLLGYGLICGYVLYSGSTHAQKGVKKNGDKTINSTKND